MDDYPFPSSPASLPGAETRFELRRDAGTFRFQGSFDGRRGRGTFTFAADPAFAEEMGGKTATLRLMELALYAHPLGYVREMRALGFARSPTPSRRFRPRESAVPEPIREMVGAGDRVRSCGSSWNSGAMASPPTRARHGRGRVSRLFVLGSGGARAPRHRARVRPGLSASGYRLHYPFQLVEIHSHGITPEWLRGIVQAGYGDATPEQLVSLHAHGIDGDAFRGAPSQGRRRPTPEELMSLQARGDAGQVVAPPRSDGP